MSLGAYLKQIPVLNEKDLKHPQFLRGAWLQMLIALGFSPYGDLIAEEFYKISEITRGHIKEKVPLVLAIVKEIKRAEVNGFMRLEDPSGSIGASVHQKVFDTYAEEDLCEGAVLVLKQVSVIYYGRGKYYLNITPDNVQYLFSATANAEPDKVGEEEPVEEELPSANLANESIQSPPFNVAYSQGTPATRNSPSPPLFPLTCASVDLTEEEMSQMWEDLEEEHFVDSFDDFVRLVVVTRNDQQAKGM